MDQSQNNQAGDKEFALDRISYVRWLNVLRQPARYLPGLKRLTNRRPPWEDRDDR